jgi:dihydroorotate dehydrogenase
MDLSGLALPLLRRLDAERAHDLTLCALEKGFGPVDRAPDPASLAVSAAGLDFPNPLGLAPGFDKDARVFAPMLRAGFGFVEAGTVTPRPQAGNPKPRIFRLPEDDAVINRLGFNNGGLEAYCARLAARDRGAGIVGANIGRNKDSEDEIADYAAGARAVAPLCDYLTINVSSPNTPGLRALQSADALAALIAAVQEAMTESNVTPPLFVKIAPDLTEADKDDIARVAMAAGIAGLIVSNTTIERPESLKSAVAGEAGGLSGRPLFGPSTRVLAEMYRRTEGKLTLIGAGGVASGEDAYAKIRAGATLVQLYTALVYGGPRLIPAIKRDLAALLARDGFASVADAVGADARG